MKQLYRYITESTATEKYMYIAKYEFTLQVTNNNWHYIIVIINGKFLLELKQNGDLVIQYFMTESTQCTMQVCSTNSDGAEVPGYRWTWVSLWVQARARAVLGHYWYQPPSIHSYIHWDSNKPERNNPQVQDINHRAWWYTTIYSIIECHVHGTLYYGNHIVHVHVLVGKNQLHILLYHVM